MQNFTAIMLIIGLTSVAQVNAKTLPIADFVNRDTVSCNIGNEHQHTPFTDLTTLLSAISTNVANIDGKPYQINKNWITGIKSLSVNTQQKNGVEQTKSMAFLVQKYGVIFLNVGEFNFTQNQNSELSGNGYYFILKGTPTRNLTKLQKQGFDIMGMELYETLEHNSRLNCFISG